jgi:hypothetical protein
MGLDMYLTAVRDVSPERKEALRAVFPEAEIETVSTTIGYWRKVNAIHAWFVRNVQDGEDDCRSHHVYKEDIETLLGLVGDVIEKRRKPEEALPTWVGPFFGDTAYDQGYFDEMGRTKTILEQALGMAKSGWRVTYQSSW